MIQGDSKLGNMDHYTRDSQQCIQSVSAALKRTSDVNSTNIHLYVGFEVLLVSCLTYPSILKMEVICSSETSIEFHLNIRHYVLEDRTLHPLVCIKLVSLYWAAIILDTFGMAAPLIERTEEQSSESRFVLLKCEVHGTVTVQYGSNCVIRREVYEWLKIFKGG
jgi:hypothetical protein